MCWLAEKEIQLSFLSNWCLNGNRCSAFQLKTNFNVSAIGWYFISFLTKNLNVFSLPLNLKPFYSSFCYEIVRWCWIQNCSQMFSFPPTFNGALIIWMKILRTLSSLGKAAVILWSSVSCSVLLLEVSTNTFFCSLILFFGLFAVECSLGHCFDVFFFYVATCDVFVHIVGTKNRHSFLIGVLVEDSWTTVLQIWSAWLSPWDLNF